MIAWQGLEMPCPRDWNLTAVGGDYRQGSLRAEAPDIDDRLPYCIEVRWATITKSQSDADLDVRIKPLITSAEKEAKKAGIVAETSVKGVRERRPDRDAERSFRWTSERAGSGRIWHCIECGRVVIAQVYGHANGSYHAMASQMLAGMTCHSAEKGWVRWRLFDLDVRVPDAYTLVSQQIMNIYVQLVFQRGQTNDRVSVEQWGLANVQLKGAYLDEWFDLKNNSFVLDNKSVREEGVVMGHPSLMVRGKRGGALYWTGEGGASLIRLKMPALSYSGALWECPDNNKTYLIQVFLRKQNKEVLSDILERARCHVQ